MQTLELYFQQELCMETKSLHTISYHIEFVLHFSLNECFFGSGS